MPSPAAPSEPLPPAAGPLPRRPFGETARRVLVAGLVPLGRFLLVRLRTLAHSP